MRLSELTKFNSIYKKTYWGNFDKHINNEEIANKQIIAARDWFILKHKIVKCVACPRKYSDFRHKLNLDHTEYYEDNLGRFIYLYSITSILVQPKDFTIIHSMYSEDQTTGIKIFETAKSKKQLYKKIKERIPDDVVKIVNSYLLKKELL